MANCIEEFFYGNIEQARSTKAKQSDSEADENTDEQRRTADGGIDR